MSDSESKAESLTSRFTEVWGKPASTVALLANIIRICENAPFGEDLQGDLETVVKLAGEGLEMFGTTEDEPSPGFGFTRE